MKGLPRVADNAHLFHDRALEIDCAPQQAADGKLRCLPADYAEVFYLDDACTEQRVGMYSDGCSNRPTQAAAVPRSADSCQLEGARVYTLGSSMLSRSEAFRKTATGCEPISGFALGDSWFEVTGERSLEDFAEVTLQLD